MLKYKILSFSVLLIIIFPITAKAISNNLEINYHALAFTEAPVLIKSENNERFKIPWEWEPLTPAYDYSFVSKGLYDPSRPLEIKIKYPVKNNQLKQIFSFDFLSSVWRSVPTKDYPDSQYVTMTTDATSAWLIVLAKPDIMTVGNASWYKYKEGLFAASPDFIKGTKLRVHNLDNNKYVDVVVNDYGPDRKIHPDRVIDLDRVAFEKIASLSAGLVKVRIEALPQDGSLKQEAVSQISDTPIVTASSAVVMMEETGEILFNKKSDQSAPLASLTKLIAVKVFLDTNPDLEKVVVYKKQDEEYNNLYCNPWESARLRVADGETLKVKDLLYSAIVGSANNAVESLVRVSGLSRDNFISKMNKLAQDLGAKNTKFVEPSGLSVDNVSSPYDYAIITKEIFKNVLIEKISTTKTYSFSTINTQKSHTLNNTNRLLKNDAYKIVGSKTGYLNEAGYCLMTRVNTEKGKMIIVQFNSQTKVDNFADNERLIKFGLKSLASKQ